MYKIDISVIIVTYNSSNEIFDCINSIIATTSKSLEFFIVDNCSKDKTIDLLHDMHRKMHSLNILQQDTNLGLAAGNNVPLNLINGEYTLIINPDAQALPDTIDGLIDILKANPKIGMIAPMGLSENNKYHSSFHRKFGFWHIILWRLMPYSVIRYMYDSLKLRIKEGEVNFVSGEFFLTLSSNFKYIKGYDERFFLSFCDVADLAIRYRNIGLINYYVPRFKIYHPGGRSNSQVKLLTQIKGVDGELYFLRKNIGYFHYRLAKIIYYYYYSTRLILFTIIYLIKNKKDKVIFVKLKVAYFLKRYIINFNF